MTTQGATLFFGAVEIDELTRLLLETNAERAELIDLDGRLRGVNAVSRNHLEADGIKVAPDSSWSSLWSDSSWGGIREAFTLAAAGHVAKLVAANARSGRAWHVDLCPLRGADGRPTRILAISREQPSDQAASQVQEPAGLSAELLRLAIAAASLGTWHWDFSSGRLTWSKRSCEMFGFSPSEELTYAKFRAAVDPRDVEPMEQSLRLALSERTDYDAEFRIIWPDQSVHWVSTRGRAVYDEHGAPIHMEGIAQDVTARRTAERELRERERHFRELADAIPNLVWQIGVDGQLSYVNRRWNEYFQRESISPDKWHEIIHPDDLGRANEAWQGYLRGESSFQAYRLRRHDGRYQWFACRVVPMRDDEGKVTQLVATATEVDQLKQAEDSVRASRARLDTALRSAGVGTWVWFLDSDEVQFDNALAQLLGYSETAGRTMEDWMHVVHADELPLVLAAVERSRERGADFDVECRVLRGDGASIWIAAKGRIEASADTERRQLFGACVDITQHKRLEEELRQAQKMEAIGQLAGGVAHDFNNLLMVILGQASLISMNDEMPESIRESVREIEAAAERAAGLTGQLLAFGRRQTMQLRDLDLNQVVESVGQMLRRLIGENIVLALEPAATALKLHADQNMLVQVLLNLALNARDAMPKGGQLSIRTSREVLDERSAESLPGARPGTWACMTLTDTGEGIKGEVLPHIFEPFFTTKGDGKGTGLGLSTVYGIVKQHHGFVSVSSTPGWGAKFRVYLPLPDHETIAIAPPAPTQALSGRKELVLLVEDDPAVRAALSNILEQHNYRLLLAEDGIEALELFARRGADVDLLLSDVVLPRGLSGADLAQQLRVKNPRLRVILCSGYSADKIEAGLHALPGMLFLQKPYRAEVLLTSMRNLLDQEREATLSLRAPH